MNLNMQQKTKWIVVLTLGLFLAAITTMAVLAATYIDDTSPNHKPSMYSGGWRFTANADPVAGEAVCLFVTDLPSNTRIDIITCSSAGGSSYNCDAFPGGPIPDVYKSATVGYFVYVDDTGNCDNMSYAISDPAPGEGLYEFTTNPNAVKLSRLEARPGGAGTRLLAASAFLGALALGVAVVVVRKKR